MYHCFIRLRLWCFACYPCCFVVDHRCLFVNISSYFLASMLNSKWDIVLSMHWPFEIYKHEHIVYVALVYWHNVCDANVNRFIYFYLFYIHILTYITYSHIEVMCTFNLHRAPTVELHFIKYRTNISTYLTSISSTCAYLSHHCKEYEIQLLRN